MSESLAKTISILGVPAPTHIKLDVDGIEGPILAGMPSLLKSVREVLVEVEGENEVHSIERIEKPLHAAGLAEDVKHREQGNQRNRLFVRTL